MSPETNPTPAWLEPVEQALQRGDRDAALVALVEAAGRRPHDEELPVLAASLCLERGQPCEAAAHALHALAVRPFYPAAVDALGVACTDALDPDLAQRVLRRGLRMAPGMENLKQNLAVARRTAKGLLRGAYDRDEAARLSGTLPQAEIQSWLEQRPERISVAVAVRDTTLHGLADCLESIAGVCDELLVADARSCRRRALELPDEATVIAVDPDGDEVAHEMLRRACRGDWVLLLESDERLAGSPREELAMLEGEALAVVVELADAPVGDGGDATRRYVLRCVRNACSLRCRGRVLPRIGDRLAAQEARWGLTTVTADFSLRRRREPRTDEKAELARLTARLDADLAADGRERAARLDRAWIHLDRGEPGDAYRLVHPLRRALDEQPAARRALDLEEPVTLEALCHLLVGNLGELQTLLAGYHDVTDGSANTRYLQATTLLAAGDPEGALRDLRIAADVGPGFVPTLPQLSAATLASDVGAALMEKGRVEEAGIAFGLALAVDTQNLEARLGNLALDFAAGDIETVLQEMDRLAESHGDDRRVWLTGGIVLGQHGELAQVAVDWMTEGCRRLPEDDGMRRRLGEVQLLAGDPGAALQSWSGLDESSPELHAARVAAILADETAAELPAVSDDSVDSVIGWLGAWLDRQVWESLDRALVRLPELGKGTPELVTRTAAWLVRNGQQEAAERLTSAPPSSPANS